MGVVAPREIAARLLEEIGSGHGVTVVVLEEGLERAGAGGDPATGGEALAPGASRRVPRGAAFVASAGGPRLRVDAVDGAGPATFLRTLAEAAGALAVGVLAGESEDARDALLDVTAAGGLALPLGDEDGPRVLGPARAASAILARARIVPEAVRVRAVEAELRATRETLRSAVAEADHSRRELETVNGEHRRKLDELVELTHDVNNLLSSTDIAVVFLDRGLRVRRFTPAASLHFHLGKGDLGRTLTEVPHRFDDAALIPDILTVARGGDEFQREVRARDGGWMLLRALPYRMGSGEVAGVIVTVIDTTVLHEAQVRMVSAQARFDAFMRNSPAMKWAIDEEGRYVFVNEAYERLMQVEFDQCIGRRPAEVLQDHTSEAFIARSRETNTEARLSEGPIHFDIDVPVGDQVHSFYVSKFVFEDAEGKRTLGGSAIEITELKRTQRRLAELNASLRTNNEELAARNLELDHFAHAASHDLRAPVRTVAGFAEIVRESLEEGDLEAASSSLGRIDQAAHRMGNLIDSLLTFASAGRGQMQVTDVSLDRALEQVLADLAREIEGAGVRVELEGALPTVEGDPTMLRQVLQNLVANAIKYRGAEAPRVTVRSRPAGQDVVLEIEDNGQGFDPADAARAFAPFQRLHAGRDHDGSGIGLSICKRVVERHSGTIEVETAPGSGSTFRIRLPLEQPAPTS